MNELNQTREEEGGPRESMIENSATGCSTGLDDSRTETCSGGGGTSTNAGVKASQAIDVPPSGKTHDKTISATQPMATALRDRVMVPGSLYAGMRLRRGRQVGSRASREGQA